MDLIVTLEHRFHQTPDGAVWTQTGYLRSFWNRYLEVFDQVHFLARMEAVQHAEANWKRADGKDVFAIPVPYYIGPTQYLRRYHVVKQIVQQAVHPDYAVIMRISSTLAQHVEPVLQARRQPYGVEVVGDPYEVFAPNGGVVHPLRPFFRWFFTRSLKNQCANASAAAYVSSYILSSRYPVSPGAFSTSYSSIELTDACFDTTPRHIVSLDDPVKIVTISSLEQLYKGPDTLIAAVAWLKQERWNVELTFVGDGKYRPQLEAQAAQAGLGGSVRFLGQLPAGDSVREQLNQADLFVLPSRTEGLPRAMIEAMALGLPCIGSTAGGIPELLPPEDMVPPNDAETLAAKIREVIADPARMTRMSARNLEKAKEYHEDILRERRNTFYRTVKEKTLEWKMANQ